MALWISRLPPRAGECKFKLQRDIFYYFLFHCFFNVFFKFEWKAAFVFPFLVFVKNRLELWMTRYRLLTNSQCAYPCRAWSYHLYPVRLCQGFVKGKPWIFPLTTESPRKNHKSFPYSRKIASSSSSRTACSRLLPENAVGTIARKRGRETSEISD